MLSNIADTFNIELPADPNTTNARRQVTEAAYSLVTPRIPTQPKMLHIADEVQTLIGLTAKQAESPQLRDILSGAEVLDQTHPYSMTYGGHQFGHWAGQLGDGRAINLFEVLHDDQRWALQLKGAGATPYSRTADGLAVLRSSIREHLCSEAMHHLGVPTTRSLSLMLTGDQVMRDMLYDGRAAYEKGAVVCRVAPSFLRFGNYQLPAMRDDSETLRKITDYTIKHFFPGIAIGTKEGYLAFFKKVVDQTMEMVIHWQRVGFVHGVMNTDNMSILGLSIDYGPYGWLEGYDPNWTPNTTDRNHKRYRFGHQPGIALWNLAQLGNALNVLIQDHKALEAILKQFEENFAGAYTKMMRQKLGLQEPHGEDLLLILDLEKALQLVETDMTIFFRNLGGFDKSNSISENDEFLDAIKDAFYSPSELNQARVDTWRAWFIKYQNRLNQETVSDQKRQLQMNKVNPKYVLRNYMAQLAIDQADQGNYALIDELYIMLKQPYAEQPKSQKWFAKRPEWARHKVGCSMLSCSS